MLLLLFTPPPILPVALKVAQIGALRKKNAHYTTAVVGISLSATTFGLNTLVWNVTYVVPGI